MKLEWSSVEPAISKQFSKWFAEGTEYSFVIVSSPDQRFWCSCRNREDHDLKAIFNEGFHTLQAAKDKCQEAEDWLK